MANICGVTHDRPCCYTKIVHAGVVWCHYHPKLDSFRITACYGVRYCLLTWWLSNLLWQFYCMNSVQILDVAQISLAELTSLWSSFINKTAISWVGYRLVYIREAQTCRKMLFLKKILLAVKSMKLHLSLIGFCNGFFFEQTEMGRSKGAWGRVYKMIAKRHVNTDKAFSQPHNKHVLMPLLNHYFFYHVLSVF